MSKFKFIPLIICLILIWNSSAFTASYTSEIFYAVLIISMIIKFPLKKITENFNWNFFWFLFVVLLSILFNDINPIFKSEIRFLSFLFITIFIGPLISTKNLLLFRSKLFTYINYCLIILSSLSYIFLVTGVYTGRSIRGDYYDRVDFTGLFNHSMTLSPLSGLAIITLTNNLLNKTLSKRNVFLNIILLILCFLSLITSGSRISLLATLFGCLFLLFKKHKEKYLVIFKYILPIIIIAISTFNLWSENANFMINKFGSSQDYMDNSRSSIWEDRLGEFESSPIWGIGFCSVKEINSTNLTGLIEPGSSWLALLSMTGIFGLLLFLNLIVSLKFGLRESTYNNYLLSYGLFFMIHFVAEGYVFASGSILFFCFWLLLGLIYDMKRYPNLIN